MKDKIKYFYANEFKNLINTVQDSQDRYYLRNELIIKLGYYCALRVSEIGLLKINDYNPSEKTLFCRRTKNGMSNTLFIVDDDLCRLIETYQTLQKKLYPKCDILFPSQKGKPISRKTIDSIMKKYCTKAQISDTSKHHFHVLRHTRAISLIELGLDIEDVRYWLGHVNIQNTMKYLSYTTKLKKKLFNYLIKYDDTDSYHL